MYQTLARRTLVAVLLFTAACSHVPRDATPGRPDTTGTIAGAAADAPRRLPEVTHVSPDTIRVGPDAARAAGHPAVARPDSARADLPQPASVAPIPAPTDSTADADDIQPNVADLSDSLDTDTLDVLTDIEPPARGEPAVDSIQVDTTTAVRDTVRTREVSVSADLLEGDMVEGERVRRLTGDVQLEQQETRLWANRAIQFLDRREILFMGNVLIVERGDTLRADSVLYNSGSKTGRAFGDVRLSDGDVLVRAPSGLYFTREKRAQFTQGVTMEDSTAVLASEGGEYWSDEKRAEFYGEVRLDEDRTHLEADSVTYERETDVSIARGNVFIERLGSPDEADADSLTRTLLFGDQAYNEDSTEYSRIEGTPLLIQLRQDSLGGEVDTLLIRAAVLESSRHDSLQRLIATDSVRIWQSDLAAVADSAVYDRIKIESEPPDDRVRLYGRPMAWLQSNQVSGDTLRVKAGGEAADTLFVRGQAFVAREDSALQRVHQLRGEDLVATFEDDSLRTLAVGPQAEAINFRAGEQGERSGAVRMSADRIIFRFDGDDLEQLRAIRGTEGTYYSEEQMPDGLMLDGFQWVPERRPTKAGLLGPVIIPTPPPQVAFEEERLQAGTD